MVTSANLAWRPTASLSVMQLRAQLMARIRHYFAEQQVLEVETPILQQAGNTDPMIDNLQCSYGAHGVLEQGYYLQTSPEYAMKRLLAAGSGPIYQVCKVFRDGESGRRHSPEFTLLEWYRPGFDLYALMDEVEELVSRLMALDDGAVRITYTDLFQHFIGVDPIQDEVTLLRNHALKFGITVSEQSDERDFWLDLLLSHIIEPELKTLGRLVFVYDYPATQAALAQINADGLAERFELYLDGVELANGYYELADGDEQRRRFVNDNNRRRSLGKSQVPIDESLLMALNAGLPGSAGVALGLDRLLMCLSKTTSLEEVLTFPIGCRT